MGYPKIDLRSNVSQGLESLVALIREKLPSAPPAGSDPAAYAMVMDGPMPAPPMAHTRSMGQRSEKKGTEKKKQKKQEIVAEKEEITDKKAVYNETLEWMQRKFLRQVRHRSDDSIPREYRYHL